MHPKIYAAVDTSTEGMTVKKYTVERKSNVEVTEISNGAKIAFIIPR